MKINDKVIVSFVGTVTKIERIDNFNGDGGHQIFVSVKSDSGPAGSSIALVSEDKVNINF